MTLNAINSIGAVASIGATDLGTIELKDMKNSDPIKFFTKKQQTEGKDKQIERPEKPVKPVEPKKPEVEKTLLEYKVKEGDTYSELAEKYHSTVDAIKALNPNARFWPGDKIQIPYIAENKWEEYQKKLRVYNAAMTQYEDKMNLYNRTNKSIDIIEKYNKKHENGSSELLLDVNSDGNIKIRTMDRISLGSIARQLNIKSGELISSNPQIKEKYTPVRKLGFAIIGYGLVPRMENNWNLTKINANEELTISPYSIDE